MNIQIIRTDGTREQREIQARGAQARLREVSKLIGAETLDFVTIQRREPRTIMAVDDNGWECDMVDHGDGHLELKPVRNRKPINAEATKIYQSLCIPGTTHQIVGDVAICLDGDFA